MNKEILKAIFLESVPGANESEQVAFVDLMTKLQDEIRKSGVEILDPSFTFNLAEVIAESMGNEEISVFNKNG